MPYRQEWVAPERMIRHQNVSIWCVYKDDDVDQGPKSYWFTTDESGGEYDSCFDVRDLPEPPTGPKLSDMPPHIGHERGKELGFDTYAEWQVSAEYAAGKALWTEWHNTGQDAAILNTLRHAIEAGHFKPNEDDEPGDDEPVMQEFSCKVGVDARVYYDITIEADNPESALVKLEGIAWDVSLDHSENIIDHSIADTDITGDNPTVIYIRDESENDHHELVDLEPKTIATLATSDELEAAREQYGSDEIEIDEGAEASRGSDGTWVQAWVLIPTQGEEEDAIPIIRVHHKNMIRTLWEFDQREQFNFAIALLTESNISYELVVDSNLDTSPAPNDVGELRHCLTTHGDIA